MKLQSAVFLFFVLALVGCGAPTYVVSGTVKFDGEPIPDGHIAFVSDTGTNGGGPISNGQYSVSVPAGQMKVQITASKLQKLPAGQKGMDGKTEEVRSYIPSKYNASTTLSEEITGAKTGLNFDLKAD
jgi:hypothetical protein